MKRRDLLAAGAAALATPRVALAQAKRPLRFVPQADLAILDPIATPGFVTRHHGFLVYDTLYGIDSNFQPKPQMVEGHEIGDDGKRWTLKLRPGLKFHDGEPVRAADVVASVNRWGKRDTWGFDLFAALDELSASSDDTVVFRLKKPFPTLPDLLGKAGTHMPCIMPARLAATDPFKPVTEMIGSGPFRFLAGERIPGSLAVYEKFTGYVPRPEPSDFLAGAKTVLVDRVEWRTMPDPATAAAALQAGEIDWLEQPVPDLLPRLRRLPAISVSVIDPSGFLALLRLNHLQPPFDNPAIRRALYPAIDQSAVMIATASEDRTLWKDGIGFFTPGPMANDEGMAVLTGPRDPDKTKAALRAAGYSGEKVVLMTPTDFASIHAMTLVVEGVFRSVGMNVELQATDWGSMLGRFNNKGPITQGGWNALCTYTTGAVTMNPADHRLVRALGEKGGVYGWPDDPKIEALRNAYLDATTEDARKDICRQLQRQAFETVPFIPLGLFYQPTAFRKNVVGIQNGFPLFWGVRLT